MPMVELAYGVGVGLSLIAAGAFAIQYLCVRLGAVDGSVTDVVFISLVCNVLLIVPPVLLVYDLGIVFTRRSILAFALAGISGSILARLFMYQSIETIGASRTSPVVASNVFFATILAIVFLGERLSILHAGGIVLIVAGVVIISREMADEPQRSLREVGIALVIPLAAAAFLAVEPIFVSVGLSEGTPVLPGFAIKALTATVGFGAYLHWKGDLPEPRIVRLPGFIWYVGAGVTSTVGIGSYIAALEVAPVVLVVPMLQTVPLIVLVLSALFLPQHLERVTWRLAVAGVIIVLGAVLVTVA